MIRIQTRVQIEVESRRTTPYPWPVVSERNYPEGWLDSPEHQRCTFLASAPIGIMNKIRHAVRLIEDAETRPTHLEVTPRDWVRLICDQSTYGHLHATDLRMIDNGFLGTIWGIQAHLNFFASGVIVMSQNDWRCVLVPWPEADE